MCLIKVRNVKDQFDFGGFVLSSFHFLSFFPLVLSFIW